MKSPTENCDVLIVGGGPAGLSAAVYLARACRSVVVMDCDRPGRSDWPQVNQNYLGFPEGIAAAELVELGRAQVERFGGQIQEGEVAELIPLVGDAKGFEARGPGLSISARAAVLATGVRDHWVEFPGHEEFIGITMHWCIVCDGYEMQGQRVLVVGNTDETVDEAIQMRRFTPKVTVLSNRGSVGITPAATMRLKTAKIPLVIGCIASARAKEPGHFTSVCLEDGAELKLDHLFSAQGAEPNNALARALEVSLDEEGYILTDKDGQTNVPGIWAAGDVTRRSSHQIITAANEGANAGTAINWALYQQEQESK
ncbi:MAG: NAD(P)/FAD-dependent oxidoreductase [Chloroflexota bacterium]|nr:NAD(P)/FAD-dependent oxidoreductase [Chloroflexota bacterium]